MYFHRRFRPLSLLIWAWIFFSGIAHAQDFSFTATPRVGCSPLLVNFNFVNDAGRDMSQATYFWDFGNTNTSVLQNPSDSYVGAGFYTVSLTVDYFGNGVDVQTVTYNNLIEVYPRPTPVIQATGVSGCAPDQVTLDASASLPNTGPGGSNTYNWTIGGVGSSNAVVVSTIFNTVTTVDLTVTNNRGCVATTSRVYQISQPTTPAFGASPVEVCGNTLNTSFTDNTTGIVDYANYTYAWDFGDGTTLSGPATNTSIRSPTHTYNGFGAYDVRLVVTNTASGCSDTLVRQQYINLVDFAPTFTADPVAGCSPLTVNFQNTSQNAANGLTFIRPYQTVTWDFGDGNTITGPANNPNFLNPSHTYANDNQTYTATMTIVDTGGNGCGGSASRTITTQQRPTPNFTAPQRNFCQAPAQATFNSTSTNLTEPVTYLWNFGDGNTSTAATPTHTYNATGNYNVSLTVTNASGCTQTITQNNFIRVQEPNLNFTANPTDACAAPFNTTITNNTTSLVPITNWNWTFFEAGTNNAVLTSTQQNPAFTINNPGSYDVQLIASNAQCSDTLRRNEYLTLGGFQAQFTNSTAGGCAPLQVDFQNTSINPFNGQLFIRDYQTVTWDFGDGNTVTGPATNPNILAPTNTFATPGTTYIVTMTVNDPVNGCNGSATTTITTLDAPIPNFDFDIDGLVFCDPTTPFTVNFTNTTTNTTPTVNYLWNFGDGNLSTQENPTHTYPAGGSYNVTLTVTNGNGCVVRVTRPIGITVEVPNLAVAPPLAGCIPLDGTFTAQFTPPLVAVSEYDWTVINTTTNTTVTTATTASNTFNFTFNDAGDYVVRVAVSGSGTCVEDRLFAQTTVDAGDVAFDLSFSVTPTQICRGDLVNFINTSTLTNAGYTLPTSFLWDVNGDGNFANVGTYTPPAAYNPNAYNATGTFTNADTTSISPTLAILSNGCTTTLTQTNAIQQQTPVVSFTTQIDTCVAPDTIRINNLSFNYDSLVWIYTVNGTSDTLINVDNPVLGFPASAAGASVSIEIRAWNLASAAACSQTLTQQTNLPALLPEIQVSSDTTRGCIPHTVNFAASATSVANYLWTFEGNGTSGNQNPTITFNTVDTFTVSLRVRNANGCTRDTVLNDYVITYGPAANFTFTGDRCAPADITFINLSTSIIPIDSVIWSYGTGISDTLVAPGISPTRTYRYDTALTPQTNGYQVGLIVIDTFGCRGTSGAEIIITDPKPDFTIDTTLVCEGSRYRFDAVQVDSSGNGLQFNWEVRGTNAQVINNQVAVLRDFRPGTDTVFLYVRDVNNCRDTISKVIQTPVAPQPRVGFAADQTGLQCPPLTVTFTDTTQLGRAPITQWTWDFGDGNPIVFTSDSSFQFTYNRLGVYNVTLQILDSVGCRDTLRIDSLIEIVGPVDTFRISRRRGYEPLDVTVQTFAPDSLDYCYQVTFGDGTLSDFCPPPNGVGPANSDTTRLFPHTYFTQNATITNYVPVIFITDQSASPSCRIGYAADTVTVLPCPTLSIPDTAYCISDAVSHTILAYNPTHEGNPLIYAWYDNRTGNFQLRPETTDRITVDTTETGLGNLISYVAQIYILDSGVVKCFRRDTMNLLFDDAPIMNLGPDRQVCDADGAQILNASQPSHPATTRYDWLVYQADGTTLVQTATGATITANHFSNNPLNPSTRVFTVTALDTASGCVGRDTIRITFRANPPVNIGPDLTLCDTEAPVNLSAYNAAYAAVTNVGYQWFLVDTVASTTTLIGTDSVLTANVQSQNNRTTRYSIIAVVTDMAAGCVSRDTMNATLLVSPAVNLPDTVRFC
ncbi:MAG: PKD domain-containing protein, partial [Bernardetiaceae bacterium]